jgi:hypothetical protein
VIPIKQRVLQGLRVGTLAEWVEVFARKYDRLRSPNFLVIGIPQHLASLKRLVLETIRKHFPDAMITWREGYDIEGLHIVARHDITMEVVQQDPTLLCVVSNRFGPLPPDVLKVSVF